MKNTYEVIIDFGSKNFTIEANSKEEAEGIIKQQIEQDKDFNYNDEWWIGDISEVEE